MRNRIITQSFLCFFFFMIIGSATAFSQNTEISNEVKNHDSKEFTTYEYADTPDYVFIHHRKNLFKTLSPIQLEILETYEYPKYVSSNDPIKLEDDILYFEKSIQRWEEENASKMNEILEALNISK